MLLAQLSDTHLTIGVLAARPAERAHQALARVQALRPHPDCLVLTGDLAMHHHPVPSGIAFMDTVMLSDADRLAAVLERHRPPTRILTGHLHRPSAAMFAGAL